MLNPHNLKFPQFVGSVQLVLDVQTAAMLDMAISVATSYLQHYNVLQHEALLLITSRDRIRVIDKLKNCCSHFPAICFDAAPTKQSGNRSVDMFYGGYSPQLEPQDSSTPRTQLFTWYVEQHSRSLCRPASSLSKARLGSGVPSQVCVHGPNGYAAKNQRLCLRIRSRKRMIKLSQ